MKKLICIFLIVAIVAVPLCSCEKGLSSYTDEMFALDTIIRFTLYDEDIDLCKETVKKCKDEIIRLENLLSATKEGSDIYALNNAFGDTVVVSSETSQLLEQSKEISKSVDSAFDISVKPLVSLWGFDTKEYKVPSQKEIENTLSCVGYEKIHIDGVNVTVDENTAVDLGGIAKGYIADSVRRIVDEGSVYSGIISLGGMIITVGKSSSYEKDCFTVGVEHPSENESYFFTFEMTQPFVSTTGGYQRFFEKDSKRYHHILDTKTGYPAESDISSVSVIGESASYCDALSTAFFVMGVEKTTQYLSEKGSDYQVIILSDDMKTLYLSKSFKDESIKHKLEKAYDNIEIIYI